MESLFDELTQFIVTKITSFNLYDKIGYYSKSNSLIENKKYFIIFLDNIYNNIHCVYYFNNYNYNVYHDNIIQYTSHLYAKYKNPLLVFYEVEYNFSNEKFIECIDYIFLHSTLSNNFTLLVDNNLCLLEYIKENDINRYKKDIENNNIANINIYVDYPNNLVNIKSFIKFYSLNTVSNSAKLNICPNEKSNQVLL